MDAQPAAAQTPTAAPSPSPSAQHSPQRDDVPKPADTATAAAEKVYAVFHHAKYDADADDHPGRLTHCWGVFSTFEKAEAKLREVVRQFPPDRAADGDGGGDVDEERGDGEEGGNEVGAAGDAENEERQDEEGRRVEAGELESQAIYDQYGNLRGLGYRYRTNEVCEEIKWVEPFMVQ